MDLTVHGSSNIEYNIELFRIVRALKDSVLFFVVDCLASSGSGTRSFVCLAQRAAAYLSSVCRQVQPYLSSVCRQVQPYLSSVWRSGLQTADAG